mmetsp:Transcript_5017/g.18430  ORF Transcript_5017/g.18430 Transcript_5017/m.18430 type:complete len:329 (+) Transcript_5017:608-1594(+)
MGQQYRALAEGAKVEKRAHRHVHLVADTGHVDHHQGRGFLGNDAAESSNHRPIIRADLASIATEQTQTLCLQGGLGARAHVELAVYLLHVVGDRVAGQAQLHADFRQGEALGDAQQHLGLAIGQRHLVQQGLGAGLGVGSEIGNDLAGDRGRQRRLTLAHALQLLDEQFARLFLEQIAEGTSLQRGEQVLVVVMDRDDHRLHLGLLLAQRGDHLDARAIRQAQVQQRQRETLAVHQRQRVLNPRALGDLGVREHLLDQGLEPGADFGDVFEQQDVVHGDLDGIREGSSDGRQYPSPGRIQPGTGHASASRVISCSPCHALYQAGRPVR